MGFFDIFKSKKKLPIKISSVTVKEYGITYTEDEYNRIMQYEHSNNPIYFRSEKEKKLSGQFFATHFDEIQKRRDDLSECCYLALSTDEPDLKIALLQKSLEKYYSYKKWCYKSKGGTIFFQDKYEYLEKPDGSLYTKEEQIKEELMLAEKNSCHEGGQ